MKFIATSEIIRVASEASADVILDGPDAETFPIPLKARGEVVILVMYFKTSGPPKFDVRAPPHYAMHINGETGKVLRFWPVKPGELWIKTPLEPVPGAGLRPSKHPDEFLERRERLLARSPEVWEAYASGSAEVGPATAAAVKQYLDDFLATTSDDLAPFYVAASPDYFRWLRAVAAR